MKTSSLLPLGSAVVFSLMMVFAPRSSGALLAYEGFDYAPGALTGQAGGTGFSTAWGTTPGSAVIQSPGMSYDALANTGGALFVDGAAGSVAIFRDFSFSRGAEGTTTWISMLHIRTGATGGAFGPGQTVSYLRPVNLAFFEAGSERISLGEGTRNQLPENDQDVFGVLVGGSAANAATRWTTTPIAQTNLAVMRIDHGVGDVDTAYLWMNPGLGAEPSIATADATTTGDFDFNRVRPFAGNPSAQSGNIAAQGYLDEFRVGETFLDVTPVPEPSTWALLGLGLLAFLKFCRKQK